MGMNRSIKIKKNSGQAVFISIIFFLFITIAIISGLVSPSMREYKIANDLIKSHQSLFLSESATEDSYFRLRNGITIGSTNTVTLGTDSATATITDSGYNQKTIIAIGDVSSRQRTNKLVLRAGEGAVFKYGTQAGQGGFVFENNSYVIGSLYSNGNILGSNGAYVTGDAFVAGDTGLIDNMCIGGVQGATCASATPGSAHAHNVTNTDVAGTIYCQTGSGNNKACNTTQADPVAQNLPISDADIATWENDSTNNGTTITTGDVTISTPTTLGPRKIIGNLTITSTLTLADTIYVTGNIIISGTIKLASSFGATSGIIIADGYIDIGNTVVFQDSGTPGSYILLLSNSVCDSSMNGNPCNGNNAIYVGNNSNISIVNAQKGTVYFKNNASVKESVGNKIRLKQNVGISYGSGIINVDFTSGPSGSWSIRSWNESK